MEAPKYYLMKGMKRMKAWKQVMTMFLATVMIMMAPMSVLADSTVSTDDNAVMEVKDEEEKEEKEESVTSELEQVTEEAIEKVEVVEEAAAETENITTQSVEMENIATQFVETVQKDVVEKVKSAALVSTQDAKVQASYAMFKVTESAKLKTYSDGGMEVDITYPGSAFLKMYLGTVAEAAEATEGIYEAEKVGEDYHYVIPVKELDKAFDAAVYSSKSGSWKDNELTISLQTETPEKPAEPSAPANGKYTIDVTTEAKMFNVVNCLLTVKDGKMTAVVTLSGTGYDYLYIGDADKAAEDTENWIPYVEDAEGKYTFEIPVEALDKEIPVVTHASKSGNWTSKPITLLSETIQKYVYIPADGTYTIDATTNATMFNVGKCVLTVKDGKMTAVVTLSGTGYDYLYIGDADKAAEDTEKWIPYVETDGKYAFEIPIEALDEEIPVVAHASKSGKWSAKPIVLDSATLKVVSNDEKPGTGEPEEPSNPDQGNAGVTDDDAIKDIIENTTKGEVKDGTYTPSFGYKGGSGRVTLSCSKVVVKNGKATATIVFASPNFTYMKVNGTKYYNTNAGGNSTFVVPVNLNGTTTVAAETTAMSMPYEVEYVLYVYVDGTNVSNIKTPTKADAEKSEEESEVEEAEVENKEENSWGAFNSTQKKENDTGESAVSTEADTTAFPTAIVIVIVGIVAIAGIVGAVVLKKKQTK